MRDLKMIARAYGAAFFAVALQWGAMRPLLQVIPPWARGFHLALVFLCSGIGAHATFLLIWLCMWQEEFARDFAQPNPLHLAPFGMRLTAGLFSFSGPFFLIAALTGLGRFRRKLAGLFRILVFPVGLLYPPVFVTWSDAMSFSSIASHAAMVGSLLMLILGVLTLKFYTASFFDPLWTPKAK